MRKSLLSLLFMSSFLLTACEKQDEKWVKQTEGLLKKEYGTSDIKFYSSFYTDIGYEKNTGAVCGHVIKLDYAEDDNNELRKYYALVINDGKDITSVTDVDFDIYVSVDRWNKYCYR
ncbi:Uncharacterised protein [Providencia rustigianii]|uniref:Lipoprotein n=1 Tax=Providencia rustigianii TaxID=158850 RepID=A0A379G4L3_9GAMM|nr:hypothetical protein [Providencia rustigianii]SUC35812.1 Uncharacterised protein [Providencia rustigianii]